MTFKIQQFIENKLLNAEYEFDKSVGQWAGWIKGLPGVYAQCDSVELARRELAETLEEYILASLQEKKKIKGFNIKLLQNYAPAN